MGDYLIHYGVKGMKWGKRKARRFGSRPGDGSASGDGTGKVYKRNKYTAPNRPAPASDSEDFKSRGSMSKDNHIRGVTGALGYIDRVSGKPVWRNSGPASNLTKVNTNNGWRYQIVNPKSTRDKNRFKDTNSTKKPNPARYGNFQMQREQSLEKNVGKLRFSKKTLKKVENWLAKILGKK